MTKCTSVVRDAISECKIGLLNLSARLRANIDGLIETNHRLIGQYLMLLAQPRRPCDTVSVLAQ